MKDNLCDCLIVFNNAHVPRVVYCKLHRSARAMADALLEIVSLAAKCEVFNPRISDMVPRIRIIAQEAVTKAGGTVS